MSYFFCYNNQIDSINLINNPNLFEFNCNNNLLKYLNVKNGNNLSLWYFTALNNDSLMCINVDNVAYANYNWVKDWQCTFSDNCYPNFDGFLLNNNDNKKLNKVIDIFGRTIDINKIKTKTPLFYIYNDGSVEKRVLIK